jgi:tetratricopeptide (TPR) repeat protein
MLKRRFQLLLLAAVILIVYYPAIFAELNSIDDVGMVSGMLNTEQWSLRDLFFPKGGIGLYYRPLLSLSFLISKELWFMETSFLHLENILMHLFNAILVYVLALKLLSDSERKTSFLPLVAALCFGLHPIAAESVNWVSGRTDLIAGSFLLLCALSLVFFNRERKSRYLLSATIALLCAVLTKEVSLAFLLGAFFLLNARSSGETVNDVSPGGRLKRIAPEFLLLGVMAVCSVLVFWYLRTHPYTYNSSKLRMTFRFISDDPVHALFVFLRAFGFYLKKIYWPFPLNYAIMEVDPLYELLAMPIVLGCGYLAVRRNLISATFLAGVCMITPAFLPAFNQVAWTPYAERYAYVASAFVSIASVLFLGKQAKKHNFGVTVKVGVPCLLAIMGVATFQRGLIWQSNISLYKDTVAKSPEFSKAWNELGVAYYRKKDLHNAELSFAKASALYSLYYDEKSDLNLAAVLLEDGRENEAAMVYKRVLKKGGDKSATILEHYIEFLATKKLLDKGTGAVAENQREMIKYQEKLYALNDSPLVLYQLGEISVNLGDRQKACEYFKKAGQKFKQGDIYKEKAKRQLKRLEEE